VTALCFVAIYFVSKF